MGPYRRPLVFVAAAPCPRWRRPICGALSHSQAQPREEAISVRTNSVRKRVRTTAKGNLSESDPNQELKGPRPARGSVHGVDVAIGARALAVLPQIIRRDLKTLSYGSIQRAVTALVHAEEWASVVEVFETAEKSGGLKGRFTARIYTDFFFAIMKTGTRAAASRGFDEYLTIVDAGQEGALMGPRAYNFLYVLLSRVGMVDEAMHVGMGCASSEYYLNRYSYNAFLSACAKAYRMADAFETLREMAENNVQPDVVSFNVLISCCVRSGDLDIALGILYRMREWGIQPDVYSYNSVVNGLRRSKMLEDAFALVAQMEVEAEESGNINIPLVTDIPSSVSSDDEKGSSSDNVYGDSTLSTASNLIKALTFARQGAGHGNCHGSSLVSPGVKHASLAGDTAIESNDSSSSTSRRLRLEQTTESDGESFKRSGVKPDLVTYNTLISGLAGLDQPDYERAVLIKKHVEERGLRCNEVTYNALMAVASRAQLTEETFKVYEEMMSRSLKPNCECFTTLITLCGRANMIDRAFQIHEHMITSGIKPSVITFNALLTACRSTSEGTTGESALKVLRVMRESKDCKPDVITYSTVIDALGRGARFSEIHDVLTEMDREGVPPNLVTYTSVISAFTRAGDLTGALRVLDDMERHGIRPNVYTFSTLIHGAGRRGEFGRALEILRKMRERGITASRITYSMLLQLAVRSGRPTILEHVVDMLGEDKRLNGTAQLERILELSRGGKIFNEEGSAILEEINVAIADCISAPNSWGKAR